MQLGRQFRLAQRALGNRGINGLQEDALLRGRVGDLLDHCKSFRRCSARSQSLRQFGAELRRTAQKQGIGVNRVGVLEQPLCLQLLTAFQRHAMIERTLLDEGWVLDSFDSEGVTVH